MKDIGLIQILRTLSGQELKKFDKFLRSPYFTEGKSMSSRQLYKYFLLLKKFYPEFKDEEAYNKKLYAGLYPGKNYNDTIMRKLNSDMLRLIENFLSYQEYEINETEFRHNTLVQLKNHKAEKVFLRKFNDMLEYLNKLERDEDYFYETYRTWHDYYGYYYLSKDFHKLEETLKNTNNFFIYVVLGSLRIYLWALSFENVIHKKNRLYLYDEILMHVKQNYKQYREIPQILFYYNLLKMTSLEDEGFFVELKSLKKKSSNALSELDKYNYFIMMTNFCSTMIQNGNVKYMKERFLLDKEFLSSGLIKLYKGLHLMHFVIIARNAVRLKEFRWAENFAKEMYMQTALQYREFALNYTKALIEFERKHFDRALELLSKLKIEYSRQKQYIRNLMIQIYFEKKEYDAVIMLTDTSRHFIRREKKLSVRSRENLMNFISFTEKLLRAKEKGSLAMMKKIRDELHKANNIENKEWLMSKVVSD